MSDQLMLKYRPRKFADVIGQEHVVTTLSNLITSRNMHQTYIFSGPFGDGKCLIFSAIVNTESGLKRIGQIVPTKPGISKIHECVYQEKGLGKSSNGYCELNAETVKIVTRDGFSMEGTKEHPVRIMDSNGQLVWKKIGELTRGDFVAICRDKIPHNFPEKTVDWKFDILQYQKLHNLSSTSKINAIKIPHMINSRIARLFGFMVSEGNMDRNHVCITNEDDVVVNDIVSILNDEFAINPSVTYDRRSVNTKRIVLTNIQLADFFTYYQMNHRSDKKVVPDIILNSPKSVITQFLRAYFEGDGGVDGHAVTATSKSRELLADIQVILLTYGIVSTLHEISKKCTNCANKNARTYYRLSVQGTNLQDFESDIGFISDRKNQLLRVLVQNLADNPNIDVVPNVQEKLIGFKKSLPVKKNGNLHISAKYLGKFKWPENVATYSKWHKNVTYNNVNTIKTYFDDVGGTILCEPEIEFDNNLLGICIDGANICSDILNSHYFYSPVEEISYGRADVYDICKDGEDKSFIANGFVNHNTSCARILAASENCENGPTLEPCGKCKVCREIFDGQSSDIKEMNAASTRSIDDIRNLIDFVRESPLHAKYKYVILDECHSLTPQAAEAALKMMEEPPENVRFILCTTDIHKMKLTVHSRCLPFRFSKVSWPQLFDHLKRIATAEKYQFDENALRLAAKMSKGSVRNSLNNLQLLKTFAGDNPITEDVAQKALGAVDENDYFELTEAILAKDAAAGYKIIHNICSKGQDVDSMMVGLTEHIRNLLVLCTCQNTAGLLYLSEEEKKRYTHQVSKMKSIMNSVLLPIEMIKLLSEVSKGISLNLNPQMLLESFLIQAMIASAKIEKEAKVNSK